FIVIPRGNAGPSRSCRDRQGGGRTSVHRNRAPDPDLCIGEGDAITFEFEALRHLRASYHATISFSDLSQSAECGEADSTVALEFWISHGRLWLGSQDDTRRSAVPPGRCPLPPAASGFTRELARCVASG